MRTRRNDLERLFAHAGLAERARHEARERERAERQREIERRERRSRDAEAHAPEAAARTWSWLVDRDASTLRELLCKSGIDAVTLLDWVTGEGRPLPAATYGAWRISLVSRPGTLWVRRIGSPMGGRSRSVETPDGLLGLVPAEVIVALDEALGSGTYERAVRAYLRERARPDADPANVIRLACARHEPPSSATRS